ncbi:MAG: CAP domain-containing protein [Acidobacteriia bacterium]|nr:CAP domain-containing protein [Terriglobia bacterium]
MVWALLASLAMALNSGAVPAKAPSPRPAGKAKLTSASYQLQPSPNYDAEAERQLFELANQAREQSGLRPLESDEGLAQAARAHAADMAAQQQLSHQFPGEPSLTQRVAAASNLRFDRVGENVAYAASADQAQDTLMTSPPHRENLLNPAYNVAGFGVVRSGNVLFVAQDFGHNLPQFSAQTAQDLVAASVAQMRQQQALPTLQRDDGASAPAAACAMAKANSLNTTPLAARYLLRYTSMQPETLPSSAAKIIGDRSLRAFSVGACYASSASYPGGVYWVALLFY